jgi:hypothetical protein
MGIIKFIIINVVLIFAGLYLFTHVYHKSAVIIISDDAVIAEPVQEKIIIDASEVESVVIQSECAVLDAKDEHIELGNQDADYSVEIVTTSVVVPSDSFVSIPVEHAAKLSKNIQETFDLLIGGNIDGLLDLIAQSNNNLLSTDSCKTCAIDAILKKVSKHKLLSKEEIVSLQHVVMNLYRFVNTMRQLHHETSMTHEQYLALKNLNTSQVSMEHLAMQARQAATIAALQSLKNIDMVQRQG